MKDPPELDSGGYFRERSELNGVFNALGVIATVLGSGLVLFALSKLDFSLGIYGAGLIGAGLASLAAAEVITLLKQIRNSVAPEHRPTPRQAEDDGSEDAAREAAWKRIEGKTE